MDDHICPAEESELVNFCSVCGRRLASEQEYCLHLGPCEVAYCQICGKFTGMPLFNDHDCPAQGRELGLFCSVCGRHLASDNDFCLHLGPCESKYCENCGNLNPMYMTMEEFLDKFGDTIIGEFRW